MRYHASRLRVVPELGTFRGIIARAAGAALSAPGITEQDRQTMKDLRREDGRTDFRRIDRMLDLLAKLPDDAPALAMLEDLRGAILARRARGQAWLPLPVAIEQELLAEAAANPAQIALAVHEQTAERLREALDRSLAHRRWLDRLIDAINATRFRLAMGGHR